MQKSKLTTDIAAAVHGLRSYLADGHNCGNHYCTEIPNEAQQVVEALLLLHPNWARAKTNIDTRLARVRLLANANYRVLHRFCSASPTLSGLLTIDPDDGFDDHIQEIANLSTNAMNAVSELMPRENYDERTSAMMILMNMMGCLSSYDVATKYAAEGNADEIDYLITESVIYVLDSSRWLYDNQWVRREKAEDEEQPEEEAYARFMHTRIIDTVAPALVESLTLIYVEESGAFRERTRLDLN